MSGSGKRANTPRSAACCRELGPWESRGGSLHTIQMTRFTEMGQVSGRGRPRTPGMEGKAFAGGACACPQDVVFLSVRLGVAQSSPTTPLLPTIPGPGGFGFPKGAANCQATAAPGPGARSYQQQTGSHSRRESFPRLLHCSSPGESLAAQLLR